MESDHLLVQGNTGLRIGVAFAGAGGVLCVLGLAFVVLHPFLGSLPERRLLGLVVVLGAEAWWLPRALRIGGELSPQGMLLHGYLSTRDVPWRNIESVDTAEGEDEWSTFLYLRLHCRDRKRPRTVPGRWGDRATAYRDAEKITAWRNRYGAR